MRLAAFRFGYLLFALSLQFRSSQRSLQCGRGWRLNGATRAGRKPRLQADQLALIEKELLRGAAAQGFATDLWTLPRVTDLIKKLTGVSYHAGHVWKILKLMGWSLQRPTLRAKERDEAAVQQWNTQTWAKVKKTPKTATHG